MRIPFLRRHHEPDADAALYSEAQALVDDGLDPAFVLSLYPDDADWLEPLLDTAGIIGGAYAAEEPSFYFEASLKAKFLGEAAVTPAPAPARSFRGVRTAMATGVVLSAAAAFGALTFGFVTSEDAGPGEWNYALKLAAERFEYSLARGDERVDVQIDHTEARIYEIRQLAGDGNLNEDAIDNLTRELDTLLDLARRNQFDSVQAARANSLYESTVRLLEDADESLAPAAQEAIETANDVAAAASGGVGDIATPTPTEEPSPEPEETPTPEPTATAEPTGEPAETATVVPPPPAEDNDPAASGEETPATGEPPAE